MGIKYLNRFLQNNCKHSIKKIALTQLSNKKIVIDTSIYMYKFLTDGVLLENMYLLISLLRKYNIAPLFVFDGKPPKEKNQLLQQRKENKRIAENKYKELEENITICSEKDKQKLTDEMNNLKKDFVRLNHKDIQNVKELIQSMGVSYIEAPGEADILCAKLVNKNLAYACLSEDMDMFVYGCKRVLRYLSLINSTTIMYDLKEILVEINIPFNDFKNICIISGTDYNIENNTNLNTTLKYYKKFNKSNETNFINWLTENTSYINEDEVREIYQLFNLNNVLELKSCLETKIKNTDINISILKTILEKEDFIFIN
jgi:flap endonuclease-1